MGPSCWRSTATARWTASPVPIVGVDAIDDAESITAGPDDTFFLLTSHSPNRRGKIAQVALSAPRAEARQPEAGRDRRDRPPARPSRSRRGAGRARSSRVDHRRSRGDRLSRRDALHRDQVAPPARRVGVDRPARSVCGCVRAREASEAEPLRLGRGQAGGPVAERGVVPQGIADLFFAPDGALYLCANSPKGAAETDGGGALWRVADQQGGRMEAHVVHRFSKLKPEGVTAAPDGKTLTVVFDRDRLDPLWMKLPLGH